MNKVNGDASVFIGIGMIMFIMIAGLAMIIPVVNFNIKTQMERDITEIVYSNSNLNITSAEAMEGADCWGMDWDLRKLYVTNVSSASLKVDGRSISSPNRSRDICTDGNSHVITVTYNHAGLAGTNINGTITYKLGVV